MMAAKSVIRSISIVIFILCRLYIFGVECKWIPPCQKVVNGEIDSVPASSDSIYLTRDLNGCNCGPDSEMSQIGYILVPVSYLTAGDENAENLKAILMDNAIHKKQPNELAPDGPPVQQVPLIRDGPPVQVLPQVPDRPPVQDKTQVQDEPQLIEQNNDSGNYGLEINSEIDPNTSIKTPDTKAKEINDDSEKDESNDDINITDEVNPFYKKVQDVFESWGNDEKSSLDSDDDVVKLLTDNPNSSPPVNKTPDHQSEDDEDLENIDLSDDDLVGDDEDTTEGDDDASNDAKPESDPKDDEDSPTDDDQDTDTEEDEDLAKVDLSDDDLIIDDDEDEDDDKKATDNKDDNVKISQDDANIKWQEDLAKYKLDMCSNIVSYQTKLLDHVLRYMDYIKVKMDQQRPPTPAVPVFNQGVVYPSYNQNYVQPDHHHHHHLGHEQNPSMQHYTLPSATRKSVI